MSTKVEEVALGGSAKPKLSERIFYPVDARGQPKIPMIYMGIGFAMMFIGSLSYRLYQHYFSFDFGLDYFEADFQIYWMNLLKAQLILIAVFGVWALHWVWKTRERTLDDLTPERELARYYLIFGTLALASFSKLTALGLFAEADAAWHQVTIRDTDFTPTHIGLFYFMMPLDVVGMVFVLIWVHTRLPDFKNRLSVPLLMVVTGPFLILPNLGFNEWGHTFFYAEELFAAPIHWGFVVLGWMFFGMVGFILQCLSRVSKLTSFQSATIAH